MLIKPDLNKPVFKIFPEKRELVEQDKCPMCSREINEADFKDNLSKKEYTISGLCQTCQKEIFDR
jgi:DNA repair exonuclease SbcCD ATPase subunit